MNNLCGYWFNVYLLYHQPIEAVSSTRSVGMNTGFCSNETDGEQIKRQICLDPVFCLLSACHLTKEPRAARGSHRAGSLALFTVAHVQKARHTDGTE